MAGRSSFPLIDRLLDGKLEARLREQRGDGRSYADVARWLLLDHAVTVSDDTVARWCADLGIEKAEPEAATA